MSRAAAERAGRRAEDLAALWLRLKGYRVVARRFRVPQGEIDLVVMRGRTLAFVEVKTRPTEAAARTAITPAAERRLAAAGALWLARHAGPAARAQEVRYDLVTVAGGRIRHHRDVFRPEGSARDPAGLF